jgi:hypothetical protein|tara:strand:- start:242 stop:493 length:252 start_codon:yes stop_codon:yes gene_type:complete
MKNIGKYIALLVITIVTLSFTYNKSVESREMVYVCDSARVKCYFIEPCKKLTDLCEGRRVFKVSLARAIELDKKECNCKDVTN